MADLVITATQVVTYADAANTFVQGTAGGTITAGQPCYASAADTYTVADANVSSAVATVVGIALHAASAGQPIRLQTAGVIDLGAGAAAAVGIWYFLSATVGGLRPVDDAPGSACYASSVCYGIGSNRVRMSIVNSGFATA